MAESANSVDLAFSDLSPELRYKLLVGVIVPRPIALVTTLNSDRTVNAAPFSFFNVFSEEPALVILGLQSKADFTQKDTAQNIQRSGEFVVNMVSEAMSDQMNICAVDFPSGVSEIAEAGLTIAISSDVEVPRIAESPVALECRQKLSFSFGPHRCLVIGEVLRLHSRPGIIDPTTLRTDTSQYRPIGRLAGNQYSRQTDIFNIIRETHDEWEKFKKS